MRISVSSIVLSSKLCVGDRGAYLYQVGTILSCEYAIRMYANCKKKWTEVCQIKLSEDNEHAGHMQVKVATAPEPCMHNKQGRLENKKTANREAAHRQAG